MNIRFCWLALIIALLTHPAHAAEESSIMSGESIASSILTALNDEELDEEELDEEDRIAFKVYVLFILGKRFQKNIIEGTESSDPMVREMMAQISDIFQLPKDFNFGKKYLYTRELLEADEGDVELSKGRREGFYRGGRGSFLEEAEAFGTEVEDIKRRELDKVGRSLVDGGRKTILQKFENYAQRYLLNQLPRVIRWYMENKSAIASQRD